MQLQEKNKSTNLGSLKVMKMSEEWITWGTWAGGCEVRAAFDRRSILDLKGKLQTLQDEATLLS